MPWCEECAKYWTPNAMNADGTCPRCGAPVDAVGTDVSDLSDDAADGDVADDEAAPWHFKLLMVALVVYLGWRFVQIFA